MCDKIAVGPGCPKRVEFVGLPFVDATMDEAVAWLKQASLGADWSYVVTPNAANLARLGGLDSPLRQLYQNAHLCFLDSRVISLAARLTNRHPPKVVPGADLVEQLFRNAISADCRICIIGGGPSARSRLSRQFAVGHICHLNPPMGFWRSEAEIAKAVSFIIESQADYTFLVVGSPGQEMLAAEVAIKGGARGVGICAGASLDFITGVQRRAPRVLQRLALEWAYRLCREPRRLAHRYLIESPRGILLVLRTAPK